MQEQVSGINKRKITEAMTKDENIWGNVRFAILLVFTVVLIFIILCKYVFDVPIKRKFGTDKRHQPFGNHIHRTKGTCKKIICNMEPNRLIGFQRIPSTAYG